MRTLLLALLLLATSAHAQQPPLPEAELQERARMMRMFALTEALELDEATAAKLFPFLREADEERRPLLEERRALRKRLKDLLRERGAGKDIDSAVERLAELDVELAKLGEKQIRAVARILSPEQRAKLMLVKDRLEQRIGRTLREERREQRQGRPDWLEGE